MLKISSQLQNIPDYPFAKVNKISKATEQRDSIKVINDRIGMSRKRIPPMAILATSIRKEGYRS